MKNTDLLRIRESAELDATDIQERESFRNLKKSIMKIMNSRPKTLRQIREKLNLDHYELGLALKSLESDGLISIDRSNVLITKFKKGGEKAKGIINTGWQNLGFKL